MKLRNLYSMLPRLLYVTLASVMISGCVSAPIEPLQQPSPLSVAQVRSTLTTEGLSEENNSGQLSADDQVLWGGVVLKAENLSGATLIEIMGYPLDRRQRPRSDKEAQGRFIARYDGFVEPLDFPAGRSITVLGALEEPISGKVGEASYRYPVVAPEQSHLWREQDLPQPPRVTFGLGISL